MRIGHNGSGVQRIGHGSKVGCVLATDKKDFVTMDRSAFSQKMVNYGSLWQLNGRRFDGVNDYVTAPDNPSISGLSAITVSAWIKATSWGDANSYYSVISKANWGSQREYRFRTEAATNLTWGISNDGNSPDAANTNVIPLSGNLSLNNWHYIVGTYDTNNANILKLYVDGILKDTDTGEAGPIFNGTALFSIGSSGDDGATSPYTDNFPGTIDEVCIYNRAQYTAKITRSIFRQKAGIGG